MKKNIIMLYDLYDSVIFLKINLESIVDNLFYLGNIL